MYNLYLLYTFLYLLPLEIILLIRLVYVANILVKYYSYAYLLFTYRIYNKPLLDNLILKLTTVQYNKLI